MTVRPLINVAELVAADPASVLIVDCRSALADPDQGLRDYTQGHIPGAVHADLDQDLSKRAGAGRGQGLGRHPLPHAPGFAASLARWGWQPGRTVVAYDAGPGAMAAARLWWLLRWMGAPVRVLDGGLAAWQAAEQPLAQGVETVTATLVPAPEFDLDQVLNTATLRKRLAAGGAVLIDARAGERFAGRKEPVDPVAGHVPGAHNRPWTENLRGDGHWRDAAALRADFERLLQGREPAQVVHMCGSGVTACHNLLAMEVAGLSGSRLYAPSWSGWISDPDNPVATD